MNNLRKLIDKIIFALLCMILLVIFIFWKGLGLKQGGPGDHTGQTIRDVSESDTKNTQSDPNSVGQKSSIDQVLPLAEPPKVAKLFLGRRGVSEDQEVWRDIEYFADFIQQLKDRGIKEVHYTLLSDSIERYEEKWKEELKKAKMIYAELHYDTEAE